MTRPNWPEIESFERDERAAILAADGIDPAKAVEMTRANIEARKSAYEAAEKAKEKAKFMDRMREEHAKNREREERLK